MNKVRILSLFLVVLLLISLTVVFASCGSDKPKDDTTIPDVTTKPERDYYNKLPDKNFDNADFTIFQADSAPISKGLTFDTLTGDRINDAIYKRDQEMLKRYNINIKYAGTISEGDIRQRCTAIISSEILSGGDNYDLYEITPVYCTGLYYGSDYFYDLNSLPILDMSQDWWSGKSNQYFELNNKLYLTTGSISIAYYGMNYCLAYNEELADRYQINQLYDKDLYTLVLDGVWTYDKFIEMMKFSKDDLNGDGLMEPAFDQFGFRYDMGCAYAFLISAGGHFSEVENGLPVINLIDEGSLDLIEFIKRNLGYESEYTVGGYSSDTDTHEIFNDGRSLFGAAQLAGIASGTGMAALEFDYGLIPLPKYNEQQEDYHSYSNVFYSSFISVPSTVSDLEKTGLVMEALACLSHDIVRPEFVDIALMIRGTRDEQSRQMLNLIIDAAYFDLNVMFNFGGTRELFVKYIHRGPDSKDHVSSFYQAYIAAQSVTEGELQAYIDSFLD